MNFCSEILVLAGEVEVKDLNDCISSVTKQISALKLEVKESLEKTYVQLFPLMSDNWSLVQDATSLTDSVNQLQSRLETQMKRDVANLTTELKELTQSLKESSSSLKLVNELLAVDALMKSARIEEERGDLLSAAQQVGAALDALSREPDLRRLDIYPHILQELNKRQDTLTSSVLHEWRTNVKWDVVHEEKDNTSVTLIVASDKAANSNLIRTLEMYKMAEGEIKEFGEKLLKYMLLPIVRKEASVTGQAVHQAQTLNVEASADRTQQAARTSRVMENLLNVFAFLNDQLDLHLDPSAEVSFLSALGAFIADDFLLAFVEFLLETVPVRREQLSAYSLFLERVLELQKFLKEMGFMTADNKCLQEYCGNIEELFAHKIAERYLDTGRTLMKKNLQALKQVGPIVVKEPEFSITSDDPLGDLSANIFQFPTCQISESADEVLGLVHEVLSEMAQADSECALKLYETARNIIVLYMVVVPMHHKTTLETIPQQSAVLHNNLMYLSHKCITLELEYKPRYTGMQRSSFVHMVDSLRSTAASVLQRQIDRQVTIINGILRNSGMLTLGDHEVFPKSIEKAIRQCLRQLSILHEVWLTVLPINVYAKLIGLLANSFLDELIHRVVATKDIRADTATQLVIVFTIVQDKLPSLFPEPKEILRHVKRWSKFNELVLVLGGSLVEIGERWADGKGPLALEFTPDQVRQLIKALFQVSERRAAVLATI